MKKILLIVFVLLLAACSRVETPQEPQVIEQIDLKDFFMKDGTIVKYKGEGNEFAQMKVKTQWLYDRYVNLYIDNGGTVMLITYRIDEDKIVILQKVPEAYEMVTPSEEELNQMAPLYTHLHLPLEKGATFGAWTVTDTTATLETPLQTFQDVIVLENQFEDGSMVRESFAKGYGLIKSEYIMKDGYTVSSTIAEIESPNK